MSDNQTVAIIGYGTAGVNAAIALRAAGYAGTIRAFSNIDTRPYSPILTSYYVGGEKNYDECFPWSQEELDELQVEVVSQGAVVKLDPAAHLVRTALGGESIYDKCVVSVGARPTATGFPKDCGYEPLVLRTLDDAERMRAAFRADRCKKVLVSGASMIALKAVEAALNCGLTVHMVGMNPHVLDFSAVPETAERFEQGLAAQGVKMRFGQTIARVAVAQEGPHRLEVAFSGGEVEGYDEIVVAHGVRSDFGFIEKDALVIDRGLVVDDFMRTSDPDVYAAGDAAQALELVSGEKHILGIWKTAALQGACAGRAIAAELAGRSPLPDQAYRGAIMTNTIAVNGTLFISGGVSMPDAHQQVEVETTDAMTLARVFEPRENGARQLVGFSLACDVDKPGGIAYDTGAMLTARIEQAFRR